MKSIPQNKDQEQIPNSSKSETAINSSSSTNLIHTKAPQSLTFSCLTSVAAPVIYKFVPVSELHTFYDASLPHYGIKATPYLVDFASSELIKNEHTFKISEPCTVTTCLSHNPCQSSKDNVLEQPTMRNSTKALPKSTNEDSSALAENHESDALQTHEMDTSCTENIKSIPSNDELTPRGGDALSHTTSEGHAQNACSEKSNCDSNRVSSDSSSANLQSEDSSVSDIACYNETPFQDQCTTDLVNAEFANSNFAVIQDKVEIMEHLMLLEEVMDILDLNDITDVYRTLHFHTDYFGPVYDEEESVALTLCEANCLLDDFIHTGEVLPFDAYVYKAVLESDDEPAYLKAPADQETAANKKSTDNKELTSKAPLTVNDESAEAKMPATNMTFASNIGSAASNSAPYPNGSYIQDLPLKKAPIIQKSNYEPFNGPHPSYKPYEATRPWNKETIPYQTNSIPKPKEHVRPHLINERQTQPWLGHAQQGPHLQQWREPSQAPWQSPQPQQWREPSQAPWQGPAPHGAHPQPWREPSHESWHYPQPMPLKKLDESVANSLFPAPDQLAELNRYYEQKALQDEASTSSQYAANYNEELENSACEGDEPRWVITFVANDDSLTARAIVVDLNTYEGPIFNDPTSAIKHKHFSGMYPNPARKELYLANPEHDLKISIDEYISALDKLYESDALPANVPYILDEHQEYDLKGAYIHDTNDGYTEGFHFDHQHSLSHPSKPCLDEGESAFSKVSMKDSYSSYEESVRKPEPINVRENQSSNKANTLTNRRITV